MSSATGTGLDSPGSQLDLELPLSQTCHPGGLTFKNSGSVWPFCRFSSLNYHYFRCQQEHVYILLLHWSRSQGPTNLRSAQPLPSGPAAVMEDARCSLQACASTVLRR